MRFPSSFINQYTPGRYRKRRKKVALLLSEQIPLADVLSRMLGCLNFDVSYASSSTFAHDFETKQPDVVFSGLYDTVKQMWFSAGPLSPMNRPKTIVITCANPSEATHVLKALQMDCVDDYLMSPFDHNVLTSKLMCHGLC